MVKFYTVLIVHCTFVFVLLHVVLFFAKPLIESFAILATYLLIMMITFRFTKRWYLQSEVDAKRKAVLITGCDSGFGYLLAESLDRKGFKVFASCLFPCRAGASELKKSLSEHSKVFGMDVTNQESIKDALKYVKENLGSHELWAVVNNAGVRKGFTMELSSFQDFADCMEVNALGHVRVTKAFLNLLRPSKGRIINLNSISSRIPLVHIFPYCMSKHAAAGFNDCLRAELANTGIKVISMEASTFLTPMTEMDALKKNIEEKIAENEDEIIKNCGKDYIKKYKTFFNFYLRKVSKDVHIAMTDLEHAVCSQYPESIYKTCPSIILMMWLKIYAILPPFIQDTIYHNVTNFFCKLKRL